MENSHWLWKLSEPEYKSRWLFRCVLVVLKTSLTGNSYVRQHDEELEMLKKARRPGRPPSAKEDMLKLKISALRKEEQNGFCELYPPHAYSFGRLYLYVTRYSRPHDQSQCRGCCTMGRVMVVPHECVLGASLRFWRNQDCEFPA